MKKRTKILGAKFKSYGWDYEVIGKCGPKYVVYCIQCEYAFRQWPDEVKLALSQSEVYL